MEIITEISCGFVRRGNVDLSRRIIMSAVRILRSTWPLRQPCSSRAIGGHYSLRVQSYLQDASSPAGRIICDHNASPFCKGSRVAQPPILTLSPFYFSLTVSCPGVHLDLEPSMTLSYVVVRRSSKSPKRIINHPRYDQQILSTIPQGYNLPMRLLSRQCHNNSVSLLEFTTPGLNYVFQ